MFVFWAKDLIKNVYVPVRLGNSEQSKHKHVFPFCCFTVPKWEVQLMIDISEYVSTFHMSQI
jgi:hypothetical protein